MTDHGKRPEHLELWAGNSMSDEAVHTGSCAEYRAQEHARYALSLEARLKAVETERDKAVEEAAKELENKVELHSRLEAAEAERDEAGKVTEHYMDVEIRLLSRLARLQEAVGKHLSAEPLKTLADQDLMLALRESRGEK